ncbi:MAG: DUF1501 domain-containing protein, partial [Chloroflexi bacterium]|nr:DUF1501 domain-containing protein [Chloroflexota bacterium]
MKTHPISRRRFLVGCSAAIASLAGARLTSLAFAAEEPSNEEILIVLFLRGGCDGLSIVPPISGSDRGYYESSRPVLKIPSSGENAALPLDDRFGLHPAAAPLFELYQDKHLAIIHAAGLTSDTRSHFDAMEYMERGTPDNKTTTTGWITRHLRSTQNLPEEILLPALAVGSLTPTSFLGSREVVAMTSPDDMSFIGNWQYANAQRAALRRMYDGDTWLHQAGLRTLDAVDIIEAADPGTYAPEHGAVYPEGEFGDNLQVVAQMIKQQLGLRIATVDLGGWDTHEDQGYGAQGYFSAMLTQLAQGLHAFYTDLDNGGNDNPAKKLTIVVMSEFGRRLRENAAAGTDHGHGNVMMVLGGSVNGGQVYGQWPGLHTDQLYDHADVAVTTDYRQVLSEILIRRLGNPQLGEVFPNYRDYSPLGIVEG